MANYPLPRPTRDPDPRYTHGMLFEVAGVLEAHGYPKLDGKALVDLSVALFGFIYEKDEA